MFKIKKVLENGVRVGELTTAHGKIATPFFMPVGTVGSVKGMSSEELKELGAQIVLSNTYHLFLRPGEKLIKKLGGLHKFMNWDGPILTDSGGYQVFSLGKDNFQHPTSNIHSISNDQMINGKINDNWKMINDKSLSLVKVTDEGVEFKSFLDGSKHLFTPEKVIQIQLDLGVDILMPLDVCPSGKATKEEVENACKTTIRWAERSKRYFDQQISKSKILNPKQIQNSKLRNSKQHDNEKLENDKLMENGKWKMVNGRRPLLHGIVQGGLYPDLRKWCAKELIKLDFDGYSVGGLAVDHETRDMWKTVKLMGQILPVDKPRYLMGVGTPDDIIKATKLGMDMFDCVLPTRMARHGSVYKQRNSKFKILNSKQIQSTNVQNYKLINLLNSKYRTNGGVIDEKCGCPACRASKIHSSREIPTEQSERQDQKGKSGYSIAYISHLLRSKEILGIRLTTEHNLFTYLNLMKGLTEEHSFQDNE